MTVLIVDDEGNLRRMLRALLESEGFTVHEASDAPSALRALEAHPPEAILLDLVFPGSSGLDLLPRLLERAPGIPVIMMSGAATLADAMEATRRGAFHFLEKPLTPESILLTLRGAMEVSRARALTRTLREELDAGTGIVGTSPEIEAVRERIRRAAPTDARILITGESGTGKELVAAAIHELSPRRGRPFVRVNSAAIPRDLVESEMFGHERGAFTGATERRHGRFELAHEGTLFLDEVGDLGAEAQAKLLRALETGTIQRVGGTSAVQVDVRVIAATNRDLSLATQRGGFREDLLFRLAVVPIHLPALRDRLSDLPLLLAAAAERLLRRQGLACPPFDADALRVLEGHRWPGNVRELFNLVERVAILHPEGEVSAETVRQLLGNTLPSLGHPVGLPQPVGHSQRGDHPQSGAAPLPWDTGSLQSRLAAAETQMIEEALRATNGNVAEAARALETDRANLYRRMRRLGIREESP